MSAHENLYDHWMNKQIDDETAALITPVLSEFDNYRSALKILWDCIHDLQELGATVAICGVDPDVLEALQNTSKGAEIESLWHKKQDDEGELPHVSCHGGCGTWGEPNGPGDEFYCGANPWCCPPAENDDD